MNADYLIHFCYLLALLISKVHLIESCVYIVESRRVIEMRNLPEPEHMPVQVHLIEQPFGVCEIPAPLRDRWMLVTEDKERIRIRSHSMTVRYPHVSNTTKVKYRCLESKGHTFLLGTETYIGNRAGVLCLGFANFGHDVVEEYGLVRLNGEGIDKHMLSPQLIPRDAKRYPSLNDTCIISGDGKDNYAKIMRAERRCVFPDELQRRWNYTYRSAHHVAFAQKTFTMTFMNGSISRFDCNVNEGDIYVLRASDFLGSGHDGIMCFNITTIVEDPVYKYEISRLNSGDMLEHMVKPFPVGKPVDIFDDCDWIESPARPEYIY